MNQNNKSYLNEPSLNNKFQKQSYLDWESRKEEKVQRKIRELFRKPERQLSKQLHQKSHKEVLISPVAGEKSMEAINFTTNTKSDVNIHISPLQQNRQINTNQTTFHDESMFKLHPVSSMDATQQIHLDSLHQSLHSRNKSQQELELLESKQSQSKENPTLDTSNIDIANKKSSVVAQTNPADDTFTVTNMNLKVSSEMYETKTNGDGFKDKHGEPTEDHEEMQPEVADETEDGMKKKKKKRRIRLKIRGIRNLNKYQDFRELSVGAGERSNRFNSMHSLLRSPRSLSRPGVDKARLPLSGKLDPIEEQKIKDINVGMLNRLFEILCRTNKYVPGLTYTYSDCSLEDCDWDSEYDYDNNPELLLKQIQHEIKLQAIEEEKKMVKVEGKDVAVSERSDDKDREKYKAKIKDAKYKHNNLLLSNEMMRQLEYINNENRRARSNSKSSDSGEAVFDESQRSKHIDIELELELHGSLFNGSNAASLNSSQYKKIYKKFKRERYEPVPIKANKETQEPKGEELSRLVKKRDTKHSSILASTMTEIGEDVQEFAATKYDETLGGIRSPGMSGAETQQTAAEVSPDRSMQNKKIELANQRLKEKLKKEKEIINPYISKPPMLQPSRNKKGKALKSKDRRNVHNSQDFERGGDDGYWRQHLRSPSDHEQREQKDGGMFLLGSSAFKTTICKEVYGGDQTVRSAVPQKRKKYRMTALELASHLFKNSGNVIRESLGPSQLSIIVSDSKLIRRAQSKELKKRKKKKKDLLEMESPMTGGPVGLSQTIEANTTKNFNNAAHSIHSHPTSFNTIDPNRTDPKSTANLDGDGVQSIQQTIQDPPSIGRMGQDVMISQNETPDIALTNIKFQNQDNSVISENTKEFMDMTVEDIPESSLNQQALSKQTYAFSTIDNRQSNSRVKLDERKSTIVQTSETVLEKGEKEKNRNTKAIKMKAEQRLPQMTNSSSPEKAVKMKKERQMQKRESLPIDTEGSQRSLLGTQHKQITNNHSTLEFSNTKEKMNAYQYETLSQDYQSAKMVPLPKGNINKFIINRRQPPPYIKEVINEKDSDRGKFPQFPPIKKSEKSSLPNNDASFSTLKVPQLNLKNPKDFSSQNSRSQNLKNWNQNNLSTSIGQSEQNVPIYNDYSIISKLSKISKFQQNRQSAHAKNAIDALQSSVNQSLDVANSNEVSKNQFNTIDHQQTVGNLQQQKNEEQEQDHTASFQRIPKTIDESRQQLKQKESTLRDLKIMKRYVQDPIISQKFRSLYKEINGAKKDQYGTFKQIANTLNTDQSSTDLQPVLAIKDKHNKPQLGQNLSPIQNKKKIKKRNIKRNQSYDSDPYLFQTANANDRLVQTKSLQQSATKKSIKAAKFLPPLPNSVASLSQIYTTFIDQKGSGQKHQKSYINIKRGPESTDENQNSNREQLQLEQDQQFKTNKSEDNAQRIDDDEVQYEMGDIDKDITEIVSADRLFSKFERSGGGSQAQPNESQMKEFYDQRSGAREIGQGVIENSDVDASNRLHGRQYYFDTDNNSNHLV